MEKYNKVNLDDMINSLSDNGKYLYGVEDQEYRLIENLVSERKRQSLTQADISLRTGMSQQAVSRIEKYGNKPSLTNLLKYMKALNLDINSMFN
jgi:DNA-binding XRE family transcriptional regulator